MKEIVIGSRGSPLALQQARLVQESLRQHHETIATRIQVIRTSGDKMSGQELFGTSTSVKGLFVKEIQEALLSGFVDLSVHSLKDLPTELPAELCLGAIPRREDPRDVLIAAPPVDSLSELPKGARVGTSSLRRRVQLQNLRADLMMFEIRGNVETRIRKVKETPLDAIVLAVAGLKRLRLHRTIDYIFPIEDMIPAAGQGALAVEIRRDDESTQRLVEPLDHPPTRACVTAERLFLDHLGGGCRLPIGANAFLKNGAAAFSAFVGSPTRGELIRKTSRGSANELEKLAMEAVEHLLSRGGRELLRELDYPNP